MQESMASSFEITCKHPSPKTREKVIRTNGKTPISSKADF